VKLRLNGYGEALEERSIGVPVTLSRKHGRGRATSRTPEPFPGRSGK
jgi:hypothetical protein